MLVPKGKIGYIPNALDFSGADSRWLEEWIEKDMDSLRELGAIFISGGNTFVLRQAMRLSGLDEILKKLRERRDFLYAGYSAAGAVLAQSLKAYEIVDKPEAPYRELKEVIWEGLGFVDFTFMPHWDSNHPESKDVERAIDYCRQNKIPFKAIRDGEVIII